MAVNVRVEVFHGRGDRERDALNLMRRFKRACNEVGVMRDYKDHEFYEKPCEKRNRKRRQSELHRRYAQEAQSRPAREQPPGKRKFED